MPSTIQEQKAELRRKIRGIVGACPPEELAQSDRALFAKFLVVPQVKRAATLLLFWGMEGFEPDTMQLVSVLTQMGKRVCLPRMIQERGMLALQYVPGDPYDMAGMGIREPARSCPEVKKKEIELVLVPAMCYDTKGYRLGFGGGYYDRWLSDYAGNTVGLCKEKVLQRVLPTAHHDRPVELVLTEQAIYASPHTER